MKVPAGTDSVGFARMIVTAIAAFEDLDLASVAGCDSQSTKHARACWSLRWEAAPCCWSSPSVPSRSTSNCRRCVELRTPRNSLIGGLQLVPAAIADRPVEVFEFDEATDGTRTLRNLNDHQSAELSQGLYLRASVSGRRWADRLRDGHVCCRGRRTGR